MIFFCLNYVHWNGYLLNNLVISCCPRRITIINHEAACRCCCCDSARFPPNIFFKLITVVKIPPKTSLLHKGWFGAINSQSWAPSQIFLIQNKIEKTLELALGGCHCSQSCGTATVLRELACSRGCAVGKTCDLRAELKFRVEVLPP